jgi:hypothetical protein
MQKTKPLERFRVSLAYRVPNEHINTLTNECFIDEIEPLITELKRNVPNDAMIVSVYVLNISSIKPDGDVRTSK